MKEFKVKGKAIKCPLCDSVLVTGGKGEIICDRLNPLTEETILCINPECYSWYIHDPDGPEEPEIMGFYEPEGEYKEPSLDMFKDFKSLLDDEMAGKFDVFIENKIKEFRKAR